MLNSYNIPNKQVALAKTSYLSGIKYPVPWMTSPIPSIQRCTINWLNDITFQVFFNSWINSRYEAILETLNKFARRLRGF